MFYKTTKMHFKHKKKMFKDNMVGLAFIYSLLILLFFFNKL